MSGAEKRVGIIIVNWRGWRDTIECLESVFRMNSSDFRVIVCDNASGDGSLDHIESWAKGTEPAGCQNPELSYLVDPPLLKPLPCVRVAEGEPEMKGALLASSLLLVQGDHNGGFAAGCNLGIRIALLDDGCDVIWLLNNDTVVDPEAMSAAVRLMDEKGLGMCGSMTPFYYKPTIVQVKGGLNYQRWTGRVLVRDGLTVETALSEPHETHLDFINGASWFLHRSALERCGLLNQSYFLYFEELDYASRLTGMMDWDFAADSVVYHKAGASAGSARDRMQRSERAEYYATRARVLIARRYFSWAVVTNLLTIVGGITFRAVKGRRGLAKAMLRGALSGLTEKLQPIPMLAAPEARTGGDA